MDQAPPNLPTTPPALWAGNIAQFCRLTAPAWGRAIAGAHQARYGRSVTRSQASAWADSRRVLATPLRRLARERPAVGAWGLAFEYELPWEGGRRPDLVLLAAGWVIVIEFKMTESASAAGLDQVAAYARDLSLYQSATHGRPVRPVLIPTRRRHGDPEERDGVLVLPPQGLASFLEAIPSDGSVDLEDWLAADYAPLPGIVAAARRIFRREPLPAIRQAASAGIPAVLDHLATIAAQAAERQERHIALITGVPGAGKTLVGLEFVHRQGEGEGQDQHEAVFLSGNGPLVEVLQHALRSKVFVRPLRNFYIEHEVRTIRAPAEHIIIFDEAQRAWDAERMAEKYQITVAAPTAVARIAGRAPGWCLLVGLIGAGQEIHAGEEGGPGLWAEAVDAGDHPWVMHCPPNLAGTFAALPPARLDLVASFDLTRSLRTHRADRVDTWIGHLLDGAAEAAQALATELTAEGFAVRLTRDLDAAKAYCRDRYADAPDRTFGLLASSRARNLPKHGVPNDFPSTQRVRLGPWFVDPAESPESCRALTAVATEFGCQGLELDGPIVCWGDDLTWDADRAAWTSRVSRQKGVLNPARLRLNSYRVLLSRGRDGLVVFVPPEAAMDATAATLERSGFTPLDRSL